MAGTLCLKIIHECSHPLWLRIFQRGQRSLISDDKINTTVINKTSLSANHGSRLVHFFRWQTFSLSDESAQNFNDFLKFSCHWWFLSQTTGGLILFFCLLIGSLYNFPSFWLAVVTILNCHALQIHSTFHFCRIQIASSEQLALFFH